MVIKNKKAWVRVIEAFFAIILIMGVLLIIVSKDYSKEEDSKKIYERESFILREVEFNSSLRSAIIGVDSLPVEWEDFDSEGIGLVKDKIINRTPSYLDCVAKLCEIENLCVIEHSFEKNVYASSVGIYSDLTVYSPRKLRLLCGVKNLQTSSGGSCTPDCSGGEICVEGSCTEEGISNYFGDGSDGDVTIISNTQLTVLNKNGVYDGDMIVMNYNTLTINSGAALTTDQPGRGMLIYVQGDAVINGELSMTARGAYANPAVAGASDNSVVSATGIRLPVLKSGETETLAAADFAGTGTAARAAVANQPAINGNGKIYTIDREGGVGALGVSGVSSGNTGGTGAQKSGGGGSGGSGYGTGHTGDGGDGTCFSGGAGSGAVYVYTSEDAADYGGLGGAGYEPTYAVGVGGGAGNPGGAGDAGGSPGQNGIGGLIILIVRGDLTIGSSGEISAKGMNGGILGGAGSGGGNILVLYGGTLSNLGNIIAAGGIGDKTWDGRNGGNGGNGFVQIAQID